MTLYDEVVARGWVPDDWMHWQQGHCGGYAAALIHHYPHLRLGGIDFYTDPLPDGTFEFDNPGHYVAHDDNFAYDSAGIHPLPYQGFSGDGRWLPDMGTCEDFGLDAQHLECGDYDDAERAAVLAHATKHNILPVLNLYQRLHYPTQPLENA